MERVPLLAKTSPPAPRFSDEQLRAITHEEVPLLISAGAGSGKTSVLTERVAYLIEQGRPHNSLIIATFTNRAAQEFRERLNKIIGPQATYIRMGTLHSTGAKILRVFADRLNYTPNFNIYDESDSQRVVKKILKSKGVDAGTTAPTEVLQAIKNWKESLVRPDNKPNRLDDLQELFWECYETYEKTLLEVQAMDFADLISKTVTLLEKDPEIPKKLGVQHVLVDEFQDTDPSQLRMLRLLTAHNNAITCVGDLNQAIFSFRGARPEIMAQFEKYFPNAASVNLGQNYRCNRHIVNSAAHVIGKNPQRADHHLWTNNPLGNQVVIQKYFNGIEESFGVVNLIKELNEKYGIPLEDQAIIYRTNYQSQTFEAQLVRMNVPYKVVGYRFFDRPEIKSVVTYLKWINNPMDNLVLEGVVEKPPRNVTKLTWEKMIQESKERELSITEVCRDPQTKNLRTTAKEGLKSFVEELDYIQKLVDNTYLPKLIRAIVTVTGLGDWFEENITAAERSMGSLPADNIDELIKMVEANFSGPSEEQIPKFLEYASLMSDEREENNRGVNMLTIHSAKGSEFRVVFIVGCEEGTNPHYMALRDDDLGGVEEERRLMYVAMTRAKELLHISYVQERRSPGGGTFFTEPSRFLKDLPEVSVRKLCKK